LDGAAVRWVIHELASIIELAHQSPLEAVDVGVGDGVVRRRRIDQADLWQRTPRRRVELRQRGASEREARSGEQNQAV
jgi:hypothetical protein